MMVFGGSWDRRSACLRPDTPGPGHRTGVRGIFLFRQSEVDWLYKYGASELYPEGWQDFVGLLQESERDQVVEAYHRRLTSGDEGVRLAAAKAWSTWEGLTVTLLPDPKMLEEFTEDNHAIAIARIENHYMRNSAGSTTTVAGECPQAEGIPESSPGRKMLNAERGVGFEKPGRVDLQIVADGGHLFTEHGTPTDGAHTEVSF